MTAGVPASLEVRRQAVLAAARQLVLSESFGPPVQLIAASLLQFDIDVLRDPYSMAALSVLGDCIRYGLKPSPRALAVLGCTA